MPASFGDHQKLNYELIRQFRLAEDLIKLAKSNDIENPGAFVKEKFSPDLRLDTLVQSDWKWRMQAERAHADQPDYIGPKQVDHLFRRRRY